MSDLNKHLDAAVALAKQAVEKDDSEEYKEAIALYKKAIRTFEYVIKYEKIPQKKATIEGKIKEYLDRAEQLQEHLENPAPKKKVVKTSSQGSQEDDMGSELQTKIRECIVKMDSIELKGFQDIAGLETAKDALQEACITPIMMPHLFEGKRRTNKGILLYGPPGTGKTHIARATAAEVNGLTGDKEVTFMSVTSSDLVSKWLGQGERMIKAMFDVAREQSPAIIFIDEVDALCSARGEGENEATRRMKNVILTQMDGVGADMEGILVLGATNMPFQLDLAVNRRFGAKIYIPLPDEKGIEFMFGLYLGEKGQEHGLEESDFKILAKQALGYSGADISIVCRAALNQPIRKIQTACFFREALGYDGMPSWEPVAPTKRGCPPGAREMTWRDCNGAVKCPLVMLRDVMECLKSIKPSVSAEQLPEYERFTDEFGRE